MLIEGFGGGLDLEKWSRNFDSGTQSAIFGTPKTATFRDPNHPQNPQLYTLGTFFGPRKVIFGHFVNFAYFYLVFRV